MTLQEIIDQEKAHMTIRDNEWLQKFAEHVYQAGKGEQLAELKHNMEAKTPTEI